MHAYLIVGGSGKTRTEKLEEILGQRERFNLGVDDDDSLKIEDVREAGSWTGLKRKSPGALLVEEADRLTLPAQHAFLKTLEEPGDNILIVLTAADGLSLLATIRSRCKIIRLPAVTSESAEAVKFAKLNAETAAEGLVSLYPILKEITGSIASLHRGAVKRGEAINFLEAVIPSVAKQVDLPAIGYRRRRLQAGGSSEAITLSAAATAHRRLKNNLNPTLVLHQFVMDISASS